MISTNPSDDIRDFVSFLKETVGSDVLRDCAGASPRDIDDLVALCRMPLPPLYLAYLREFGQNDGILKMADDADPRVTRLIEFYREQGGKSESDVPANGVVIGVYGLSGDRALLYPEQSRNVPRADSSGEPRVVVSWWGEVGHTIAATFRNHLYRQAFVRGRFRDGSLFSLYRNDEYVLPEAEVLAAELGFQRYWFSDDYQACLTRPDKAALYIVRNPSRTTLYGRFADTRVRDDATRHFVQQLNLQDSSAAASTRR